MPRAAEIWVRGVLAGWAGWRNGASARLCAGIGIRGRIVASGKGNEMIGGSHSSVLASVAVLLLLAGAATGQSSEYERAQIVAERKPVMGDLQDNYWVLFNVNKGDSEDFAAASAAAREMSALMMRFVSLLEPGTSRGEAPGSRAKPEVWSEPETFASAVETFQEATAAMAAAAETGDRETYMGEFESFTGACKACHGLRPSSGGMFRFAKGE